MALALRSLPAALAALVLSAHFYRDGSIVLAVACVAGAVLAFVRTPWAALAVRSGLVTGVIVWALTAWRIARFRMAEGTPYVRMLVILGAVAAFTALAAWMLPQPAGPRETP